MYTIGQVAKFLGVSRDTLKYYEEKGLVKPEHDAHNGYRKYNEYDIQDVITTNFYREIDIEIKKIQEIRQNMSVVDLESILEEKEEQIVEELEYKSLLLKKIRSVKEACNKINNHLGKYTIKEMGPLEVVGNITDYKAYNEYEMLKINTEEKAVTLKSARRVIYFDQKGMKEDHFVIVREMGDPEHNDNGGILYHPQCMYMVIENGRAVDGGESMDQEVGERLLKIARENGYELAGVTYINILLTIYVDGLERVFLEVYTPLK